MAIVAIAVAGLLGWLDEETSSSAASTTTTEATTTSSTAATTTAPVELTTSTTEAATTTSTAAADPEPLAGCNVDVVFGWWIADLGPACITSFPWDIDQDQPLLICRDEDGVALLNLNRYPDDDLAMPVNDAARAAMVDGSLVVDDVSRAEPLDVAPALAAELAAAADWLCVRALGCSQLIDPPGSGQRPSWARAAEGTLTCQVVAG